jgi:hypothetical protein
MSRAGRSVYRIQRCSDGWPLGFLGALEHPPAEHRFAYSAAADEEYHLRLAGQVNAWRTRDDWLGRRSLGNRH